jgi:hypothetical protein
MRRRVEANLHVSLKSHKRMLLRWTGHLSLPPVHIQKKLRLHRRISCAKKFHHEKLFKRSQSLEIAAAISHATIWKTRSKNPTRENGHTHTHVTDELTKKPKFPPKNSKNNSSWRGAYREDLEHLTWGPSEGKNKREKCRHDFRCR